MQHLNLSVVQWCTQEEVGFCICAVVLWWWFPSGPWCNRRSDTLIRSAVVAGSGSRSDKMGSPCSQLPPAWLPATKPVSKLASQSIAPLCLVPCATRISVALALCISPTWNRVATFLRHSTKGDLIMISHDDFGNKEEVTGLNNAWARFTHWLDLISGTLHFWVLTFLLKQHQVLILIQGTPKADPHPLSCNSWNTFWIYFWGDVVAPWQWKSNIYQPTRFSAIEWHRCGKDWIEFCILMKRILAS